MYSDKKVTQDTKLHDRTSHLVRSMRTALRTECAKTQKRHGMENHPVPFLCEVNHMIFSVGRVLFKLKSSRIELVVSSFFG